MEDFCIIGDEKKVFFKYLIPSMLSLLAVSAYSFVDTFVVGQANGAQAVAAMGVGTPMVSVLFALGFLCGSGGAINYAVAKSSGNREKARSIFAVSFYTALVLWLIIGICGNIWMSQLADFLGATSGNKEMAVEYLGWIVSLSGFLIMDIVLNNFMRNEGHPNVSMAATVTGTGLNIVLDFLFVMGFHWGMSGAAAATCLASIISVGINFSYAILKKTNLLPVIHLHDFGYFWPMVKVGLGSFVLEGSVAVITVVFLNFAGARYGDAGVSAFSILITLNLVCYSLLNGAAQAIQPLISANFGAGRPDRIRKFLKYGLLTSATLGIVFTLLGEIFTDFFCRMFVNDSLETLNLASYGLRFYACSFFFMAISIPLGIYYQSITNPVKSLIILLGRSLALPVVFVYILSIFCNGIHIWISVPLGELAAMLLALVIYQNDRKRFCR